MTERSRNSKSETDRLESQIRRRRLQDAAVVEASTLPVDHATLLHLDYASSGHTGFASALALAATDAAVAALAATVPVVSDVAYDASTWNGNADAPSKNAVRDKFETLGTLSTQNGTFSGTHSGTSSGTNTGDQTITLTGEVTGSGTGSFAATIDKTITPTWSGVQTYSARDIHNAGVSLGTSGVVVSAVQTGGAGGSAADVNYDFVPSTTLTAGTDRWIYRVKDGGGNTRFSIASNGTASFFTESASQGGLIGVSGVAPSTVNYGIKFGPTWGATAGVTFAGIANSVAGGYFGPQDDSATTATTLIGAVLSNDAIAGRAHTNLIGALFIPALQIAANGSIAHGTITGWQIAAVGTAKSSTATLIRGGYIPNMAGGTTPVATNLYGLQIARQIQSTTTGVGLILEDTGSASTYKTLCLRDTDAWINSRDAAHLDLNATTSVDVNIGTTEQMAITSALATFKDAFDIAVGTGTGTKIGTATSQKIGFWNATPVVQPTTGITGATRVGGGGTTITDTDTFGGYTIAQLAAILRTIGAAA